MLILPGTSALSRFRIEKLLGDLQAIDAGIVGIDARFQHFVQLDADLSPAQQAMLARLLDYGDAADHAPAPAPARTGRGTMGGAAIGDDFAVVEQGVRNRRALRFERSEAHRARHRIPVF
ncbi:hypothetical protein [Methylomonas koyamae]|uniref:hypothetical protein n=1 Tax=Methylomonas koyamae TaxID=702114 RepID=UPI0021108AFC|nr:hypothetical protein [Methylomonas koyamae]